MEPRRRPFPTFVIWLLVLMGALLAILLQLVSSLTPSGPSDITVTAEGNQLGWVVRTEAWNGTVYEEDPVFLTYGKNLVTPSQVAAGETVTISLGSVPDEVTLKEYALSADGGSPYGSAELRWEYPLHASGRTVTFNLPDEPVGDPVRGYVLSCAWGEDRCEYGIVIQIAVE